MRNIKARMLKVWVFNGKIFVLKRIFRILLRNEKSFLRIQIFAIKYLNFKHMDFFVTHTACDFYPALI
jgi:hypothetical protein